MKGCYYVVVALCMLCTGCVSPTGSSRDAIHRTFRHTVPEMYGEDGCRHEYHSNRPTKERIDREELREGFEDFVVEFSRNLILAFLQRELSEPETRGSRKDAVRSALLGTGVELTDRWLYSPRSKGRNRNDGMTDR